MVFRRGFQKKRDTQIVTRHIIHHATRQIFEAYTYYYYFNSLYILKQVVPAMPRTHTAVYFQVPIAATKSADSSL